MSIRVLIVEDEEAIADALQFALTAAGFDADVVRDGEQALLVAPNDYDVLVLDVMLPRLSGIEVCRRIRARSAVPILLLTARIEVVDRVLGLESGADDYVLKPFSVPELVSRIRALVRRRDLDQHSEDASIRVIGSLQLDLVRQTVAVSGRQIAVTPSEFRLLALLASAPGHAFTRREIVQRLWQSLHTGGARTCDVHVKNLRHKLEPKPGKPQLLVTVRGVGYMLRTVDLEAEDGASANRDGSYAETASHAL